MKLHYGLKSPSDIFNITYRVCAALGWGANDTAAALIQETIAAETQMGTYPDNTSESGHGLTQFDEIGFRDVVERTRDKDKHIIRKKFGYQLSELTVKDLDNDPTLAIIFCRLKYKLRPEPIPSDIVSRASYWKRFYNSALGKGTIEHYLDSAERHLYPEESVYADTPK